MHKLSAAYGGKWRSAFGQRERSYNERIWTVIDESHSPEDMLFGLIDKNDGSSFLVRIEHLDEGCELSDDDIENELLAPFSDPSYQAKYLDECSIEVSGHVFSGGLISIANPKFGNQMIQIIFHRTDDIVTILQFSWPQGMDNGGNGLPIKHRSLVQGLTL